MGRADKRRVVRREAATHADDKCTRDVDDQRAARKGFATAARDHPREEVARDPTKRAADDDAEQTIDHGQYPERITDWPISNKPAPPKTFTAQPQPAAA